MAIDIEGLKTGVDLAEVVQQQGIRLRRDGHEWVGLCPFHKEKSPSFRVYPDQHYYCFGCQVHGDVLDFLREMHGIGLREAAEMLGAQDRPQAPARKPQEREDVDVYAGLAPAAGTPVIEPNRPLRVWNAKRDRWSEMTPAMVFPYPGVGVVIRVDIGEGRKITPMLRWVAKPDGEVCWAICPFPKPRPLYGTMDGPQVIVVEGEKAADAARRLLRLPVVTWAAGTSGARHTDWSPVAGKRLVLWPDADQPGWDVMREVAALATAAGAAEIKIAAWDREKPKGWDAADAEADGWDRDAVLGWLRACAAVWTQPSANEQQPERVAGSVSSVPVATKPQAEARTMQQEKPVAEVVQMRNPAVRYPADENWRAKMLYKEDGAVNTKVVNNMVVLLCDNPEASGTFAYNEFANQITLLRRPPWEAGAGPWVERSVTDADGRAAMIWLEHQGMRPKLTDVHTAIEAAADRITFNPVREWFDGLKWDGHARLDTWLTYYLGAADKPFHRLVGAKWMISGVARAYEPGCKVDTMLILEGAQGIGKSKVMRTLGTLGGKSYFTDQVDNIGSKDAAMQLQGVLIIELAEMNQFKGKEVTAIKAWMTQTVDRYRPPFGRRVMSYPRHSVLGGTMNPDGSGYFEDVTGARRFWPVLCAGIDMDAIEADRDQLWAEARDRYRQGERWWLDDHGAALAKVEQDDRYLTDPWEDIVLQEIAGRPHVNGTDLLTGVLSVHKERLTRQHSQKVAKILYKAGWERRKGWDKEKGKTRILYYPPGVPQQEEMEA